MPSTSLRFLRALRHAPPARTRLPRALFGLLVVGVVGVALLPACVVRLVDRNAAEENGAVTGAPADCRQTQPLPPGAPAGEAAPKFVGRFARLPAEPPETAPPGPIFDWSGSYITVRFENTTQVTAKIALLGAIPQDQMFEFVVDNLPPSVRQITVTTGPNGQPTNIPLEDYTITNLAPGPHELTIYKNTEAQKGAVQFKGFDLHGGTLLPPTRRPRRIEFIGDSIICGYGNEGKNATCPFEVKVRDARDAQGNPIPRPNGKPGEFAEVTVPVTENQYLSFTSQAARALDADAVTICWSGKGVYKNYKERPPAIDPDSLTTVPKLWEERIIGSDFEGNKWDFATETPDEIPQVVFISLGTNDFARDTKENNGDPNRLPGDNVPDGDLYAPAEVENFFQRYLELVRKVRQRRPEAHIFLATPPMVTDQFPLDNARRTLRATLLRVVGEQDKIGDKKVYQMDLVEQGFRYGLGCDYHPNLDVHGIMAKQVIGAIRSKTCW